METSLPGQNLDFDAPTSLFEQIYGGLRDRIAAGQIAAGQRLAPTRKLAEELGVSRTTVITAYDQLIAEGFAESRPGAGVYASHIGGIELRLKPSPVDRPQGTEAGKPARLRPFHPGHLDPRLFPYRQWARCVARAARTAPEALVMNDDPFGDLQLRTEISRYLAEWRGVRAAPHQILVTAGSGEALELCIRTLADRSDRLAMEDPGYPPLTAFVKGLGLAPDWLKQDDHGFLPPVADKPGPGLAVLTPSSQFPLGGAMPRARRADWLAWAARTASWIIEDDYDSEFRYAGRPIPALAGLDEHVLGEHALDERGRTLYVGSFSKIFSGGLRMGFLVTPEILIDDFAATLRRFGSKASLAPQRPLAMFMSDGNFYRHIRRVRRTYAERRAAFLELLDTHLGHIVTYDDHRAGMQIAVRLPEDFDDRRISALADSRGVSCPALSGYCAARSDINGLLLGFCSFTEAEMASAMADLADVIAASRTG